jgi:hypothetical protein
MLLYDIEITEIENQMYPYNDYETDYCASYWDDDNYENYLTEIEQSEKDFEAYINKSF